jgi:hypothetical protein
MMADTIVAVIGIHKEMSDTEDSLSNVASLHIDNDLSEKIASSIVTSKGGRVVGQIRGNLIVEIPIAEAKCLKDIQEQMSDKTYMTPSIGVGANMEEAQMAFQYADKNTPGHIKVYDSEVMQSIDTGQDFAAANPDDKVRKAEGDDDFNPISDEEKLKVKLALEMIRQNKPLFDQMKQQAPEVYAGIVGIVSSLQLIFQEEKVRRDQKVAEVIQNLANAMQQKRDQKNNQDRTDIISNLDIDKQLNEEHSMEQFHAKRNEQLGKDKQSRKKAKKYAQKVGHTNPEFFHRLAKAFKV